MRQPKCNCPNCNNIGTHKIQLNRRGKDGHAYLCDYHFRHSMPYSTPNNNVHGTANANGYTIGVELETSKSTPKARIEIVANNYLPTNDCTVDVEYKSPIMQGLNSLSKHCVTFEKLINSGDLEINNSCGTHLHIGNTQHLTTETLDYIRRFYHSLFLPLSEKMKANPQATAKLFGRPLNDWATPITQYTNATDHTNFVNMQHSKTIEFRCCKFVTAKQYMDCAKFCVDCVTTIINNFVEHFNDTPKDKRRYPTQTAYRKHKAQTTAQKLVKLFEKYTNC